MISRATAHDVSSRAVASFLRFDSPRRLVIRNGNHLAVITATQVLVRLHTDVLIDEVYRAITEHKVASASMLRFETLGDGPIVAVNLRVCANSAIVKRGMIVDRDNRHGTRSATIRPRPTWSLLTVLRVIGRQVCRQIQLLGKNFSNADRVGKPVGDVSEANYCTLAIEYPTHVRGHDSQRRVRRGIIGGVQRSRTSVRVPTPIRAGTVARECRGIQRIRNIAPVARGPGS